MRHVTSLFFTGACLAALTGCAITNPCDGKHGGLCSAPREVYGVTNNRDQVNPTPKVLKAQRQAARLINEKPTSKDELPSIRPHQTYSSSHAGGSGPMTRQYQTSSMTGPRPLLSQPKVMRVWIAPWSHKGNLHFPGYVYTIVRPEQWVFAPHKAVTPVPLPGQ